jgi:hypothetical protein
MRFIKEFKSTFLWTAIIIAALLTYLHVGYHGYTEDDIQTVASNFEPEYNVERLESIEPTRPERLIPGHRGVGGLHNITSAQHSLGMAVVLFNSESEAKQQVLSSLTGSKQVAKIDDRLYATSEVYEENVTGIKGYYDGAVMSIIAVNGISKDEASETAKGLFELFKSGVDEADGNVVTIRPLIQNALGEEKRIVKEQDLTFEEVEDLGLTEEARQTLSE